MRHVLLISYNFPPQVSESAYRAAGFVKHLPSSGWDVSVLTIMANRGEADIYGKNVYEVKSIEFLEKTGRIKDLVSKYLIPDEKILWIPNVLRKIKEITEKQRFDLIYTIAPPHSISWLGYQAHCQTGLPWIADIRENWVGVKKHGIISSFYKNMEKKMEETIIKNARKVISCSEEWCQFFYEKYPFWGRDRFVCVPDGYDEEEMKVVGTADRIDDKLRLVFYGEINENRTHQYLLRAIKELLRKDSCFGDLLRIEFVGGMDNNLQRLISEFSLENVCSYIEDTAGKEGIKHLITADAGIVIADKEKERNIPQAIYKYIAAMKPILGLSDKGAVENLIKKENLGWVAPFSAVPRIKSDLQEIISCFKRGILKP
ncbi:MAG: glycosyltransferase, partial [Candidatus Desantisbacteria bacterium]